MRQSPLRSNVVNLVISETIDGLKEGSYCMFAYLLRRILILPVILFGLFTIVFFLAHVVPGDPAKALAGEGAGPEQIAQTAKRYGLDQPLWSQYLSFGKRMLSGDLGVSLHTWRPVLDDLADYFPATVELAVFAMLLAVIIGIAVGTISAVHQGGWLDAGITLTSVIGLTMPQFWLGMMLQIGLCVGAASLLPLGGRIDTWVNLHPVTGMYVLDSIITGNWQALGNALYHIILPGVTLALASVGLLARMTRTTLLERIKEDYIRTARAVGLPERKVIWAALRNALIPIVTMMGMQFAFLLGGTVVVESIFDWPGVGLYASQSALTMDYPAIIGITILFGIVRMVFNLIVDVSYFFIDPRIRQD